jgi:hypothetical protein
LNGGLPKGSPPFLFTKQKPIEPRSAQSSPRKTRMDSQSLLKISFAIRLSWCTWWFKLFFVGKSYLRWLTFEFRPGMIVKI